MFNIDVISSDTLTEHEVEEIRTMYNTIVGTIPMARDKGINIDFLSMPLEVAKNMLIVEITKKTREYSTDIVASEIIVTGNEEGKLTAKVVLSRGE